MWQIRGTEKKQSFLDKKGLLSSWLTLLWLPVQVQSSQFSNRHGQRCMSPSNRGTICGGRLLGRDTHSFEVSSLAGWWCSRRWPTLMCMHSTNWTPRVLKHNKVKKIKDVKLGGVKRESRGNKRVGVAWMWLKNHTWNSQMAVVFKRRIKICSMAQEVIVLIIKPEKSEPNPQNLQRKEWTHS